MGKEDVLLLQDNDEAWEDHRGEAVAVGGHGEVVKEAAEDSEVHQVETHCKEGHGAFQGGLCHRDACPDVLCQGQTCRHGALVDLCWGDLHDCRLGSAQNKTSGHLGNKDPWAYHPQTLLEGGRNRQDRPEVDDQVEGRDEAEQKSKHVQARKQAIQYH